MFVSQCKFARKDDKIQSVGEAHKSTESISGTFNCRGVNRMIDAEFVGC